MRRVLLLVTAALAVVAVATTTSITPKRAPARAAAGPVPWNGAVKEDEGPQSFLDLAASSGEPVTQAEVKRAAAQANALPDAADASRWQFVGPSNVGRGLGL